MSSALRERALPHSPTPWGRRAGGQGIVLLIGHSFHQSDGNKETTAYNGGCHRENVGERRGISPLQSFASVFHRFKAADSERLVRFNEGLSPRDRIHTTYTWRENI